ncbi:MAG: thiamine pyrophosphate-dependent enzyme, partial [Chloroflexi bacterium]|nr:thiamine pyrophosphate-dependent enzyme [Chloroflexota bacterium]
HPLALGLGGYPKSVYATKQAVHFASKADVVLGVGCSFKEFSTCQWLPVPKNVQLIHVNADVAEIHRIYPAQVGLLGDAKLVLRDLLTRLRSLQGDRPRLVRTDVLSELQSAREQWEADWRPKLTSDEVPINPYRITWELMQILDRENSIIVHDAGGVRGYIVHHYEAPAPRSFLGFGAHSNMGWSVPAAIGAKLAKPDKTVVCLVGDGAFAMNGMEVETAVRHNAPVLFIVGNNNSLTDIAAAQDKHFDGRSIWNKLSGDYCKVAQGLGAYAEKVDRPEEIRPALERALASGRAAVLEVLIKPKEPRPYTQLRPFGPTRG